MATQVIQITASNVQTFPGIVELTGTVASSGTTVTGTGTLFLSELLDDSGFILYPYIWNSTSNEIRKIIGVYSDTSFVIENAFGTDLAGELVNVIPVSDYVYAKIQTVSPTGTTNDLWQTGESTAVAVDGTNPVELINGRGIEPFCVDANGANAQVMLS